MHTIFPSAGCADLIFASPQAMAASTASGSKQSNFRTGKHLMRKQSTRRRFAAVRLPEIHFANGNSAAAFTVDGKTGTNDEHRCWEHSSWVFAQGSRQQGIFTLHRHGARPGRRRLLQNFLPRMPVYFPFSRAPV